MKKIIFFTISLFIWGSITAQQSLPASFSTLNFKENKGQVKDQNGRIRTDIDFVMETSGLSISIGAGQLHYQFAKMEEAMNIDSLVADYKKKCRHLGDTPQIIDHSKDTATEQRFYRAPIGGTLKMWRVDVILEGANKDAEILKEQALTATFNYYTGIPGMQEIKGVKAFEKITYKNIYPHIDWVIYIVDGSLKYDFVLHPDAKVSDIVLAYEGINNMQLEKDGSVSIFTPLGTIKEDTPYSYEQESRRKVPSAFVINDNKIRFKTGDYKETLVIDPSVEWATYYGGEGSDVALDLAVDDDGFIYMAGLTSSHMQIATTGAFQTTNLGLAGNPFLAKFDSTGQLHWATYYGGSAVGSFMFSLSTSTSRPVKISRDMDNNIYLVSTINTVSATDNILATPGSHQDQFSSNMPGLNFYTGSNILLVKFNSQGIRQWATFYGKSTTICIAGSVTCDKENNVYIAGIADLSSSQTEDLITNGAHQVTYGGGVYDGIIVKFDSSGKRLWSTYFGGNEREYINDIATDDSLNLYLTGTFERGPASRNNIATAGSFKDTPFNNEANRDMGFLAKFNKDGKQQWGTYLHGEGNSLAVDTDKFVYVAGWTRSNADTFIYTKDAHQISVPNASDGSFLIQFSTAGARNWGTYYGGENGYNGGRGDEINDIALDSKGNIYICGKTASWLYNNIATPNSYQDTLNVDSLHLGKRPIDINSDAYIALFDSKGKRLWGSYFGGKEAETGLAVACDPRGAVYLAGGTLSPSELVKGNVHQDTYIGTDPNGMGLYPGLEEYQGDAFLVRFLPIDIELLTTSISLNDSICAGQIPLSVEVKNQGRMDKPDTLYITCLYEGPAKGSLHQSYQNGLTTGQEETYILGDLNLTLPGIYKLKVFIHYTRDDEYKSNDTLEFWKLVTAPPVANIEYYLIGNTYHFSNKNPQATDQYHWDFGDGETSTSSNPTHIFKDSELYTITLIVHNDCGTDTTKITLTGIDRNTGISPLEEPFPEITIFPNPAQEILNIKTKDQNIKTKEYNIMNHLGKSLMIGNLNDTEFININHLPAGSYIIKIMTNKGYAIKHFVVYK